MVKVVSFGLLVGCALGIFLLIPCEVFAQASTFTPEQVELTEFVKFDGDNGILEKIKAPLAKILAGAIGIGLAIWAARFFFRIVKSMGRG